MEKKYFVSETESSDAQYCCGDAGVKIREGDVRRSDGYALRSRKNKGFTLVELIVVIVILAILAAILVPALLGYIDRAKNAQYVLYAKNAMTATQSVLTEMYAKEIPVKKMDKKEVCDLIDDPGLNDVGLIYIAGGKNEGYLKGKVVKEAYIIKGFAYIYQVNAGDTYKILYYDGESWTQLEDEADKLQGEGQRAAYEGARGLVYNIYKTLFKPGQDYQWFIHVE